MSKKANKRKVEQRISRARARIASRQRPAQRLKSLLRQFDPVLHGGEVMAWHPLGTEMLL